MRRVLVAVAFIAVVLQPTTWAFALMRWYWRGED